ncbi:unnamed protein product, partial [Didymodactylos carnosus]
LLRGPPPEGLMPMKATEDSLIAFSCAPGETASDGRGQNGLFTKHLLQHIKTPNQDIEQVMREVSFGVQQESLQESRKKQVPYRNSSLTMKNVFLYTTGNAGDTSS